MRSVFCSFVLVFWFVLFFPQISCKPLLQNYFPPPEAPAPGRAVPDPSCSIRPRERPALSPDISDRLSHHNMPGHSILSHQRAPGTTRNNKESPKHPNRLTAGKRLSRKGKGAAAPAWPHGRARPPQLPFPSRGHRARPQTSPHSLPLPPLPSASSSSGVTW